MLSLIHILDGIEMLQRIRKDFQISHIPVIILTAKGNDEAKTKAISMGANAYIDVYKRQIINSSTVSIRAIYSFFSVQFVSDISLLFGLNV